MLENSSSENLLPKWKLILFITAGIGTHLLFLAMLVAVTIFSIINDIKIQELPIVSGVLAVISLIYLSRLFVRTAPPGGIYMKLETVPHFQALLQKMCNDLNVKAIHQVIITDNRHISAGESGWFFLPFMSKRHLTIGLELLLTVTPDEFKALLMHELVHLSATHARFNKFIYRHHIRMLALHDRLSRKRVINPLTKILLWYIKKFHSYVVAFNREFKYKADYQAARYTSSEIYGTALNRVYVMDYMFNTSYWRKIFLLSNDLAMPTVKPYRLIAEWLKKPLDNHLLQRLTEYRERAVEQQNTAYPSLQERLNAIKYPANSELPQMLTSAAQIYFAPTMEVLMDIYDSDWAAQIITNWRREYLHRQGLKADLPYYEHHPKLNAEGYSRYFYIIDRLEDNIEKGKMILEQALEKFPESADLHFEYGFILSRCHDDRCLQYLKKAGELSKKRLSDAFELSIEYLHMQGQVKAAAALLLEYNQVKEKLNRAEEAKHTLSVTDKIKPLYNPNGEELNVIKAVVKSIKNIGNAYLFEKENEYDVNEKLYYLAFHSKLINGDVAQYNKLEDLTIDGVKLIVFEMKGSQHQVHKLLYETPGLLLQL